MLILEFYEGQNKVAECEASEVFGLGPEQQRAFWSVQDEQERSIKLRMEGEK